MELKAVIERLNLFLRGWGNYFRTGNAAIKFVSLDRYVWWRLFRLIVDEAEKTLLQVDLALAREYGLPGWNALRQALDDLMLARRSQSTAAMRLAPYPAHTRPGGAANERRRRYRHGACRRRTRRTHSPP